MFNQPDNVEDAQILQSMPAVLLAELESYHDDLIAGRIVDRGAAGLPCLWFDEATLKCRHYEFRPSVCRTFEVGSQDCIFVRELNDIPVDAKRHAGR